MLHTNPQRLLWAGFMAILAAGVGFSIRGGILGQWGEQFGFTQTELGSITGGGLTGFGIIILLSSLIADRIGFGTLMVIAFLMHLVSAGLTLAAGAAFQSGGKPLAFQCLYWGMFLFAIGNGIAEAVVNPLVASLFPNNKTKYLNILHAGWPGGLILGGLASFFMAGGADSRPVSWQIQMSLFLVPVVLYGLMMIGQRFPKSEASVSGVSYRDMLGEVGMMGMVVICALLALFFGENLGLPTWAAAGAALALLVLFGLATGFRPGHFLLAFLLVIHAMVGYVELGTDSWISKITGTIMADKGHGLLLFVYTSGLMFILRFFGGPLEHMLNPLGLLCLSGILGAIGLTLLGSAETVVMCVVAATVYALGKTFLWPTMLAVVSERFPKGGAIAIGAAGGVGMLSAGLLGGPGIGFKQDYNAALTLKESAPSTFTRYAADHESTFLFLHEKGLDGSKVSVLGWDTSLSALEADKRKKQQEGKWTPAQEQAFEASKKEMTTEMDRTIESTKLQEWWAQSKPFASQDIGPIEAAGLAGGRMALKFTAAVPATMAVLYLLLIGYFMSRGGYKRVEIAPTGDPNFDKADDKFGTIKNDSGRNIAKDVHIHGDRV